MHKAITADPLSFTRGIITSIFFFSPLTELTIALNGNTSNALRRATTLAESIEIGNPDFNVRSLRGNAVLRWEYLPGSVIYFVWTQTRSEAEEIGEFRFEESMTKMVSAEPDNIFMIKVTYWLNF